MPLPYAAALPKAKGVPKNPQQRLIVVLYILRNPPATSAALPKGLFDDEKEQNQKNTFASINIYCSHSHALQQRTSPPPPPSPPHGLPASSTPLQSIATSQPASFATRPPPPPPSGAYLAHLSSIQLHSIASSQPTSFATQHPPLSLGLSCPPLLPPSPLPSCSLPCDRRQQAGEEHEGEGFHVFRKRGVVVIVGGRLELAVGLR